MLVVFIHFHIKATDPWILFFFQQKNDKVKLEALRKRAMKSASEFNSMFNRDRREERRAFFDIHSFVSGWNYWLYSAYLVCPYMKNVINKLMGNSGQG